MLDTISRRSAKHCGVRVPSAEWRNSAEVRPGVGRSIRCRGDAFRRNRIAADVGQGFWRTRSPAAVNAPASRLGRDAVQPPTLTAKTMLGSIVTITRASPGRLACADPLRRPWRRRSSRRPAQAAPGRGHPCSGRGFSTSSMRELSPPVAGELLIELVEPIGERRERALRTRPVTHGDELLRETERRRSLSPNHHRCGAPHRDDAGQDSAPSNAAYVGFGSCALVSFE